MSVVYRLLRGLRKENESMATLAKIVRTAKQALDLTSRESVLRIEEWQKLITLLEELDKDSEECYSSLNLLRKATARPVEVQHAITRLLEECCCEYWRARGIIGGGEFCPDCYIHVDNVGMNIGDIRIRRPTRNIR